MLSLSRPDMVYSPLLLSSLRRPHKRFLFLIVKEELPLAGTFMGLSRFRRGVERYEITGKDTPPKGFTKMK